METLRHLSVEVACVVLAASIVISVMVWIARSLLFRHETAPTDQFLRNSEERRYRLEQE